MSDRKLSPRDIEVLASYGIKYPWSPWDALALIEKLERYEAALREYANESNWYGEKGDEYVAARYAEPGTVLTWDKSGDDGDGWDIARAALKESE